MKKINQQTLFHLINWSIHDDKKTQSYLNHSKNLHKNTEWNPLKLTEPLFRSNKELISRDEEFFDRKEKFVHIPWNIFDKDHYHAHLSEKKLISETLFDFNNNSM
jgi:hypothetical protein